MPVAAEYSVGVEAAAVCRAAQLERATPAESEIRGDASAAEWRLHLQLEAPERRRTSSHSPGSSSRLPVRTARWVARRPRRPREGRIGRRGSSARAASIDDVPVPARSYWNAPTLSETAGRVVCAWLTAGAPTTNRVATSLVSRWWNNFPPLRDVSDALVRIGPRSYRARVRLFHGYPSIGIQGSKRERPAQRRGAGRMLAGA